MNRTAPARTATTASAVDLDLGHDLGPQAALAAFARDVAAGLAAPAKRLPCRWFYDAEGSRLFEAICATPEYYVTRAEDELLAEHADAIVAQAPADATLVELGSGSAQKSCRLIEALHRRQPRARFVMIDVSRSALETSSAMLRSRFPSLEVAALAAEYETGVASLPVAAPGRKLVLWLGSNVGNFARDEAARFLANLRATLRPDDRFLLGVDLRKERRVLEAAYDDAAGITAQFNLNLLARINRELGGTFDLAAFRHRASFDEAAGKVTMELVSTRSQSVAIRTLGQSFAFAADEAIHTEDSFKYSPAEIDALAATAGFAVAARWSDRAGRFSESLLAPIR